MALKEIEERLLLELKSLDKKINSLNKMAIFFSCTALMLTIIGTIFNIYTNRHGYAIFNVALSLWNIVALDKACRDKRFWDFKRKLIDGDLLSRR